MADVAVTQGDVFNLGMVENVHSEGDRALIVLEQLGRIKLRVPELVQETAQPDRLGGRQTGRHDLGFARGQRRRWLQRGAV